jgi:hypothetical protein
MDTHQVIVNTQASKSDQGSNSRIKEETVTLPMNCTNSNHT